MNDSRDVEGDGGDDKRSKFVLGRSVVGGRGRNKEERKGVEVEGGDWKWKGSMMVNERPARRHSHDNLARTTNGLVLVGITVNHCPADARRG